MKDILTPYLGQTIGLNLNKPFRIEAVQLQTVASTCFTVLDPHTGYLHHYPWQAVVQVIEHEGGVDLNGGLFSHEEHFAVVIKVGQLFQYVPA